MHILVSGAKGMIGSVLTARASERGHEIAAVDDYSRGLNTIEHFKNVATHTRDCRQGIKDLLLFYKEQENPIDAVVHLAAGTGSLSRPYSELVDLNVTMTQLLYEEAKAGGVKAFIFPTTSLGIEPTLAEAPYVKSKDDAMNWLLQQAGGPRIIPLRFFNVTGAYKGCTEYRQREVHIGPKVMECFMRDVPFIINGGSYNTPDGTPARDFVNVIDVVDFILYLIQRVNHLPDFSKPLQVGAGKITTALQIAEFFNKSIGKDAGRKLKYEIGECRAYDCGSLRCTEPYLWLFKIPRPAKVSFLQEWRTLRDLYGKGLIK